MRNALPFVSAAILAAIPVLAAQTGQPPPTFKADTRLVRVSVIVEDGRRRPVPGLIAGDFELSENGRPQRVSLFAVESSARRTAAAAGPRTFSNRVDGPASTGVTVILYDRLNTRWEHQQQARAHIITYLKALRPDDRVGFYVLESDAIRVLHPFTKDAESLLKALERTPARESTELAGSETAVTRPPSTGDAAEDAAMEAWIARTEQMIQGFYIERRVNATIGALEGLAGHLAGIRGRKNVIWISSGFPLRFHDGISVANAGQQVLRATRALNGADIAIYPVDARGLVGVFSTAPSAREQQFVTLGGVMGPVETSQVIAERTGGRAFFNTNDLGGAIRRAAEDSSLTYVLGYYPADTAWDGTFREIKVGVRRRGVQVRHRKGYFALAPEPTTPATQEQALFDALKHPLETTAIGVTAGVARTDAADRIVITILVEPDALTLNNVEGRWKGAVDLIIAQALPDTRLAKELDTRVPLDLDADMRARLLVEGLTFTRTVTVRPDAHQIRIAVRDAATAAIGTVTVPASAFRQATR